VKALRSVFLAALFISAASVGFAQKNVMVDFVEGTVEFKSGSAWKPLEIGTAMADADLKSVRLGKQSYAEFSNKGRKISLSTAGTYDVTALFAKPAPVAVAGIGSRVQKLMAVTKPKGGGAAAGVRASNQDGGGFEDLFKDEYSMFSDGKKFVLSGELDKGAENLEQAREYAMGTDNPLLLSEIAYYLGLCRASQGLPAQALIALRSEPWSNGGALAPDYLALQLSLEIESNAFAEAKALIKDALAQEAALKLDPEFTAELKKVASDLK
jgi:hypothetical protein